ncbi:MAG: FKBP-type peptidyl-prolyl cis-trans isomerase [Planctomycetota bacterium]
MNLMQILIILSILALAGALTAAIADYTSIPPAAKDLFERVSGSETDLTEAIGIAKETTGGAVSSARFKDDTSLVLIEVETVTAEKRERLTITADGKVSNREDIMRFPGVATDNPIQRTDSGLMYIEITEGTGETPPSAASNVKVHYTGYLVDGVKFDSSVDRGMPATFPLNRVIAGWTEGVGSMKVGGKRKLIIPFDLAYGANGRPPTIPPRATLIFDVELLEVVKDQ